MRQTISPNILLTCGASLAAGLATGVLLTRFQRKRSEPPQQTPEPQNLPLIKAIHFSAQKHKLQKRKNSQQTPYICHPVSVANRLIDAGVHDTPVLIAALLHDTVEDTDTTLDEIEAHFGIDVAKIVDQVTDDKTLPKATRKQLQIEHAPHISHNAKLVKLADKLDNLSDLMLYPPVGWSGDRVAEYFAWAERVVAGLRGCNEVLETQLDNVLCNRQIAIDHARHATQG